MRLDKFLKLSRLVKRRTVANALCDNGNVSLEGKMAKAANIVHAGQVLTLRFGAKILKVRIEIVPTGNISVQSASTLYTILSETHETQEL